MPRRFALIAFKYPPFPQVGARRWTKLTKYLAREGWEIEVFTTDWGNGAIGLDDVSHPNITIHRVPCQGLHRLWVAEFDRSTLRGTVGWFVERVLTRYVRNWRIAEEARYWSRVVSTVSQGVESGRFDTIVVTGGPFWAAHWAAEVKRKYPSTRLILDYRDPWSAAESLEEAALDAADDVVTVTSGLADMVRAKSEGVRTNVIRNGCDLEELPPRSQGAREPIVLYAGNLSGGRSEAAECLLEAIESQHDEHFPELRFVFIGQYPGHLARRFSSLLERGAVTVRRRIPPEELMREIDRAFACLQINAPGTPFALSTKTYEYACAGRPILGLNSGGEIAEFIRAHQLGWNVRGDDTSAIGHALTEIQQAWSANPALTIPPAKTREFSYEVLGRQWSELLSTPDGSRRNQ